MLMEIRDLCAGYGDLQVLFNISLNVGAGEVVSLVGSNGAGKTTLLRILSGLQPIMSGSIMYDGMDLLACKPYDRASIGISHIPQGRGILGALTVRENLEMGAYPRVAKASMQQHMEEAFQMFPRLRERQNQMAGSLSGGEQQMLAIARSLMISPKLLMLDEPSLGLAPIVVKDMFDIIRDVSKRGVSILIVEQNLKQALNAANRGYVIETGRIVMEGRGDELLSNKDIQAAYLGI